MGRFYRPTVRTWLAARGTKAEPPAAPPGHLDACAEALEPRCARCGEAFAPGDAQVKGGHRGTCRNCGEATVTNDGPSCDTPRHFFPDGYGSACACGRFAGALPGVCIQAPGPFEGRRVDSMPKGDE